MWNKSFHIVWFKLDIENNRHFFLTFPVPLYIFQELLDCILDLLTVACLFTPNMRREKNPYKINNIKELVQMTMKLFDSLAEEEPYDLVDVTANKVSISVKIR